MVVFDCSVTSAEPPRPVTVILKSSPAQITLLTHQSERSINVFVPQNSTFAVEAAGSKVTSISLHDKPAGKKAVAKMHLTLTENLDDPGSTPSALDAGIAAECSAAKIAWDLARKDMRDSRIGKPSARHLSLIRAMGGSIEMTSGRGGLAYVTSRGTAAVLGPKRLAASAPHGRRAEMPDKQVLRKLALLVTAWSLQQTTSKLGPKGALAAAAGGLPVRVQVGGQGTAAFLAKIKLQMGSPRHGSMSTEGFAGAGSPTADALSPSSIMTPSSITSAGGRFKHGSLSRDRRRDSVGETLLAGVAAPGPATVANSGRMNRFMRLKRSRAIVARLQSCPPAFSAAEGTGYEPLYHEDRTPSPSPDPHNPRDTKVAEAKAEGRYEGHSQEHRYDTRPGVRTQVRQMPDLRPPEPSPRGESRDKLSCATSTRAERGTTRRKPGKEQQRQPVVSTTGRQGGNGHGDHSWGPRGQGHTHSQSNSQGQGRFVHVDMSQPRFPGQVRFKGGGTTTLLVGPGSPGWEYVQGPVSGQGPVQRGPALPVPVAVPVPIPVPVPATHGGSAQGHEMRGHASAQGQAGMPTSMPGAAMGGPMPTALPTTMPAGMPALVDMGGSPYMLIPVGQEQGVQGQHMRSAPGQSMGQSSVAHSMSMGTGMPTALGSTMSMGMGMGVGMQHYMTSPGMSHGVMYGYLPAQHGMQMVPAPGYSMAPEHYSLQGQAQAHGQMMYQGQGQEQLVDPTGPGSAASDHGSSVAYSPHAAAQGMNPHALPVTMMMPVGMGTGMGMPVGMDMGMGLSAADGGHGYTTPRQHQYSPVAQGKARGQAWRHGK